MEFTQEELSRDNHQVIMDGWWQETQEKIKNSTIFIAGAGGLGSPGSICLAGAVLPVLGATTGVVGTLQAIEALKHLSGKALKGRPQVWSGSDMNFKTFRGFRDPDCPTCGTQSY